MENNPLAIFGDGTQTRDFCFVDDLIDAIELSISTPNIGGHVFQIATNIETKVQTITDIILDIFREGYCIENIEVEYIDERSGDVSRNFSDVTKAKELLKWKSKINIEKGIDKTIEWYIKNY
jgi:UDP-glucose 4-epimerase